jgi:hypothetical protein
MNKRISYKKWARYKKELHRRRKQKKKDSFIPRIIVDTNIWLHVLGDNDELFEEVKKDITPMYNNLWELCITGCHNSKPTKVRKAIQKVMKAQHNMIFSHSLRYLTEIANKKKFRSEILKGTFDLLEFSAKIANGGFIQENQKETFYEFIKKEKQKLADIANDYNRIAKECKEKIKNLKKHCERNTFHHVIHYFNYIVSQATNGKYNLKKLPLCNYELLICVTDLLFKKLETGEKIWERNDLFDLYNLAYVRRGDKYWTNERKWIEIIKEAGCEEYLYNPSSNK